MRLISTWVFPQTMGKYDAIHVRKLDRIEAIMLHRYHVDYPHIYGNRLNLTNPVRCIKKLSAHNNTVISY